jgi:hypothetical protein
LLATMEGNESLITEQAREQMEDKSQLLDIGSQLSINRSRLYKIECM